MSMEQSELTVSDGVAPALQAVPLVRNTIIVGFRQAASSLWGPQALEHIASLLPPESRHTASATPELWLPEQFVLDWYVAAFKGPCDGKTDAFLQFIDRMMDHGFGRIRKFLLGMIGPKDLVLKAPELWRHDHTTGVLKTEADSKGGRVILENHIYNTTMLSRTAIAEVYRYAAALSRVREVKSRHHLTPDGSLEVFLSWQ
jgi:hypothetical protein